MNFLFLVNALIPGFIGLYLFAEKRNQLTGFFLLSNIGLALWSFCIYQTEELYFPGYIDLIAKVQLVAAMVFVNGYYWLCSSYPYPHARMKYEVLINILSFAALSGLILFSDAVTSASVQQGQVVYTDSLAGYGFFSFYISFFCVASLVALHKAWKMSRAFRAQIRYLFFGIGLFVTTAIVCNLALPVFGNYNYLVVGRLSAIIPSLFFTYVIIKHSFLDIEVIINRRMAWLVTLLISCGSIGITMLLSSNYPRLGIAAVVTVAGFWSVMATPFQQFLLTSAKRKFIRGWYSTESVIQQLADAITQETNREEIFRVVADVIDRVFEVEEMLVLVAVRDGGNRFTSYRVVGQFQNVALASPLTVQMADRNSCCSLGELDQQAREQVAALGMTCKGDCLLLPFQSPEGLEGIILLGERSSQRAYTENDARFFNNLISFITPVLYRLTPMEKLEELYNENRRKLHEAEIQLIRAQKIESIAHATRQCHHEIRTPLNIIRLGINRIKTLEDLESYKSVAREEIDHALEIVDQTLAITELSEREARNIGPLDINEVIRRCLRLVDSSRYKVVLELGELPEVMGNFSDLQVVITNLIHNAVEAMPEGGTLVFRTRAEGTAVNIVVEDTGEGIPESLRSRVWEPYFSGRPSTAGNTTAGRGWGLTIVNRIINEHRGTIVLGSEQGKGTRFTISLPVRSQHDALTDEAYVQDKSGTG